jgi:uncharacterized membrane protein YkoI
MKKLQIKNTKYIDDVENLEQVQNILNKHNFDIEYIKLENAKKKYVYKFYIDGVKFDYFEGLGNEKLNDQNKQDILLNALWCLLQDRDYANCFGQADFLFEFGYNENAKTLADGIKTYEKIKRNNAKLLKIFSNADLDFLASNINL